MRIEAGVYRLGPANATLAVHTARTGAAAKAGHDLELHVTAWTATLSVGEDPTSTSLTLEADATSLRVHKGTGGMQALGDKEKGSIHESIDDDVLKRASIAFRSTDVQAHGDRLAVAGELELVGSERPVTFDVGVGDGGELTGSVTLKQTDWGIKPYSALFGALKVADAIEVVIDGRLPETV